MKLLSSLTNRIFLASSLLAVLSIGAAVYIVNVRVTREAEGALERGLEEAGRLVDEHRLTLFENVLRMARLVADLPKLKAAVDSADPPTVQPLAEDYRRQVGSELLVITHRSGQLLAEVGPVEAAAGPVPALREIRAAVSGHETTAFWATPTGVLQVVTVPIGIGPDPPEILGTLSVGFALDERLAEQFKALTESEIAFAVDGRIQSATLPRAFFPKLATLLGSQGTSRLRLGDEEYVGLARPLSGAEPGAGASDRLHGPTALILRSRTGRLDFLRSLHRALGATAVVAVAFATLLSFAVARTVTGPLRALTSAMSELAATGDLARRATLPAPGPWQDEDARVLTSTFSSMTDALGRFQREAGQRERLASLGRLSTVIAHEIRNPLMIIKAAVRHVRQGGATPEEHGEALVDIDGEADRLNRLVDDVLDFARPIRFEYAAIDVNGVCRTAAIAATKGQAEAGPSLLLDPGLPTVVTDGERLRSIIVNLLTNARHAVSARGAGPGSPQGNGGAGPGPADPGPPGTGIEVVTRRAGGGGVVISVRDRGVGIPPDDLPKVTEPYFTTKRGGTGLGLAIAKNVIEGLGGAIIVESGLGAGTEVRLELPATPPEWLGPRGGTGGATP